MSSGSCRGSLYTKCPTLVRKLNLPKDLPQMDRAKNENFDRGKAWISTSSSPGGCYELCKLACASTIAPLLLRQLFYALSPAPCLSCQAPATETNTQLRTQAQQKQYVSLRK